MSNCRTLWALAAILTLGLPHAPARADICLSVIPEDPDIGLHESRMLAYDAPEFAGFYVRGTDKAWVFDGERLKRRPQGQDMRRPPENTLLETDHPAATGPDGRAVAVGSANGRAALFVYDPVWRRFEPLEGDIGVRLPGDIIWSDTFQSFLVAGSNGVFSLRIAGRSVTVRQIVPKGSVTLSHLADIPDLQSVIVAGRGDMGSFAFALGRDGFEPLNLPLSARGDDWQLDLWRLIALGDPPGLVYDEKRMRGRRIIENGLRAVALSGEGAKIAVSGAIAVSSSAFHTVTGSRLIVLKDRYADPITPRSLRLFDGRELRRLSAKELGPLAQVAPDARLRVIRGTDQRSVAGFEYKNSLFYFDEGRLRDGATVPPGDLPTGETGIVEFGFSKMLGLTFVSYRRGDAARLWLHEHGGETVEVTDPDPSYMSASAYFIERHGETIVDTGNRRILAKIGKSCPAPAN